MSSILSFGVGRWRWWRDCGTRAKQQDGFASRFIKPSYWNHYLKVYKKTMQDTDTADQQILGEALVRAYDDQIRRLGDAKLGSGRRQ
jgi:hypothetical protein